MAFDLPEEYFELYAQPRVRTYSIVPADVFIVVATVITAIVAVVLFWRLTR